MEEFENRLKRVPLRRPTSGLDARLRARGLGGHRVISLRHAAAAAIIMGVAGFAIGHLARTPAGREAPPSVSIEILNDSPRGNPFDFTVASDIVMSAAAGDARRPDEAGPRTKEM